MHKLFPKMLNINVPPHKMILKRLQNNRNFVEIHTSKGSEIDTDNDFRKVSPEKVKGPN